MQNYDDSFKSVLIKSVTMNKGNELTNELRFDRDREYWNQYYLSKEGQISKPSGFAEFISQYLNPNKCLLELGCGNGRDSIYFLNLGLKVIGIDASDYIIKRLQHEFNDNHNADFIYDDFVQYRPNDKMKFDYVYSRFTLHAISELQEDILLKNIREYVEDDGIFFIEARTVKDSLYGKGVCVNKNAFIYDKHYRRFIDANEFKLKLKIMNYEIIFFEEKTGFSKTEYSDPVLMRCIARLKK